MNMKFVYLQLRAPVDMDIAGAAVHRWKAGQWCGVMHPDDRRCPRRQYVACLEAGAGQEDGPWEQEVRMSRSV